MKIIKSYLDYLRDNPEGYWFKRKLYGWGWTPAKWQGWFVILVAIFLIIWNAVNLSSNPVPTNDELNWFFVKVLIIVVGIILVCYMKGEKPGWQWGQPRNKLK